MSKLGTTWSTAAAVAILVTGMLAVVPWPGEAHDQGVFGTRLVIVDKYTAAGVAKVVFKAIDNTPGAIHNGTGSGNPADVSGTVRICQTADPSNVALYDLPSPWVLNTTVVSSYQNPTAAAGAPGARVLKVVPDTRIKFVGKNLGDGDTAGGDGGATDLTLDFGAGYCNITLGDEIDVEVEVVDAAGPGVHSMCTRYMVDIVKSIAGGTGCKVIAKLNVPGPCGVC